MFAVDSYERTLGFFGVPNFDPRNARILAAVVELQGSVTRSLVWSKVHSGSEEDRQRHSTFSPGGKGSGAMILI
jgi:hypothetical protein